MLAVLIHSLLRSPAKISLFVSPCPLECYLQRETKIEPDLKLFKSLFNSKFLQTLIEHCLPLLFCQRVHLKKRTRKTCRTFFEFGLPVVSHVYLYPNKPPPTFQGNKEVSLAEMLKFKNYQQNMYSNALKKEKRKTAKSKYSRT